MEYAFSWTALMAGIVILLAGVACVAWYRPIADNFGHGVGSYERLRLYGLLACALGLVVMLNLHSLLLNWFFGLFFGNKS